MFTPDPMGFSGVKDDSVPLLSLLHDGAHRLPAAGGRVPVLGDQRPHGRPDQPGAAAPARQEDPAHPPHPSRARPPLQQSISENTVEKIPLDCSIYLFIKAYISDIDMDILDIDTPAESDYKEEFMEIAFEEAGAALEGGEVPIGCCFVDVESGEVIARGRNEVNLTKEGDNDAADQVV